VYLQSRAEKPLARYFPEIVDALRSFKAKQFVLDGELAVPIDRKLEFDQLLQRIHPAATRIKKSSTERPSIFIVFDVLADARGRSVMSRLLKDRRSVLDDFADRHLADEGLLHLSPATTRLAQAMKRFQKVAGNLDGVIAKRAESP
jgi:ATP-dependent DNA ligase